jgi:hypothetical protein
MISSQRIKVVDIVLIPITRCPRMMQKIWKNIAYTEETTSPFTSLKVPSFVDVGTNGPT